MVWWRIARRSVETWPVRLSLGHKISAMKPIATITACFLGVLLASSCTHSLYKATNKVYKAQAKAFSKTLAHYPPVTPGQPDSIAMSADWAGTVNFNMRKPNFVIIHHTAQKSVGETVKAFTLVSSQVSAHYVVAKDGTVYHMLNDYLRAYHAGVSKWGNALDINSCSIGIELDNNGDEPFSDSQISSLLKLLGNLKKNYSIPTANFIGHADIAPKRKPDPNQFFPWKTLAAKGFGLWYDEVRDSVPAGFDPLIAMRIIGYDISDAPAATIAFKRHFIQTDISPVLRPEDLQVLYNLYKKYL